MKYAWIENGVIRDLCAAPPHTLFTPAIAAFYSAEVPDDAESGDAWDGTTLTKPEPFVPDPKPEIPEIPEPTTPPVYNPVTQRLQEIEPERDNEGVLKQRWAVVELFTDPGARDAAIAADIEAKRIAAVPKQVTMRQARLALLQAGLLPGVAEAINAMASPQKEAAQIEWEYSQVVERNRGFVLLLGAALGLTPLQLDALFTLAATL